MRDVIRFIYVGGHNGSQKRKLLNLLEACAVFRFLKISMWKMIS
jgi:hypothetical protein